MYSSLGFCVASIRNWSGSPIFATSGIACSSDLEGTKTFNEREDLNVSSFQATRGDIVKEENFFYRHLFYPFSG